MSIYYSGAFRRSGGVVSAIGKQLKSINLKAVKRITFTFDPFNENAKTTREFLFYLSSPKIVSTNPKCTLKTEVICNRAPSEVKFTLIPSAQEQVKVKELRLISENLSTLELLQLCNNHISVLAPEEEVVNIIQTKSEKKSAAAGGKHKTTKKK